MSVNENTPQKKTSTDGGGEGSARKGIGSIFVGNGQGGEPVRHWKRAWLSTIYPFALLVFDVFLISLIFALAVHFRYDASIFQSLSRRVLLVIIVASVTGLGLIGGYSYKTNKSSFRFISEYLIVSVGVFIGVFFLIFSVVTYGMQVRSARSVVAFTLIVFPACSVVYRYLLSRLKMSFQRGNAICLIGANSDAVDLCKRLREQNSTREVIVVDPDEKRVGEVFCCEYSETLKVHSLSSVKFNSSMHGKYVEDYVVCCPTDSLPEPFLRRLVAAQFGGNCVNTYESYLMKTMRIVPPSAITMDWVLNDGFRLNKNLTYDRVKRLCDIVFSLVGLVCLSPVFLVTAVAVKLTSPGPVIFKQTRVGKHEKLFSIYKFRSMKVGSEKGAKYTAANDSRLTPIGKFLRKSRIDELPQFWNVLKGDLSIIGPRAEWVDLVKSYEKKFPYYHFRHAVTPGITGWAQVNYSYGQNDEDTVEKFHFDLYYIRRYSPVLDVIIVIKTLYMVVFGRGQ